MYGTCVQLMWHQRGILLDQKLYSLVCVALKDDYEDVRLAAVKLVWVFSHVYPEQLVSPRLLLLAYLHL